MAADPSPHLQFVADASYLLRQSAPETSAYLMAQYIDSTTHKLPLPKIASVWTDAQRQQICISCGNILIPGCSNTSIRIQTRIQRQSGKIKKWRTLKPEIDEEKSGFDTRTRSTQLSHQHAGIRKIYSCGYCGKETRIALPPPLPLPKYRKRMAVASREGEHKPATGPSIRADVSTASAVPTSQQQPKISTKPGTTASVSFAVTGANSASNASSRKRAKNRKAGLLALLDKTRENPSNGRLGNLSLSFDDFRKK